MKFPGILMALVLAGGNWSVRAESTKVKPLALEDCLQAALEHNLNLQIERYNSQQSLFDLRATYGGFDPVFSISGQHSYNKSGGGLDPNTKLPSPSSTSDDDSFSAGVQGTLPTGLQYNLFSSLGENYGSFAANTFDNSRGSAGVSLTQPLLKGLWIDSTRLSIATAKNTLKSTKESLRGKVIDTVTQAENAYFELIAAREGVKVQEKGLQLAERLLAENKRRVEVGAMAPLEEKSAEAEVAGRRSDLLSAKQTLAVQQNVLRSLLSANYQEVYDTEYDPTEALVATAQSFQVQDSWRKGIAQRPDLAVKRLALENKGIQLRYDHSQLFPQLDLFGTYRHNAGGNISEFNQALDGIRQGNQPAYTYGAQLSIPLSNQGARNRYKSSKLDMEKQVAELKLQEQGVLVEIDNAVISARTSLERVEATRQARLYSESALDAEQKKLENGKTTSYAVLQFQRDLILARSAEIRALVDYNKALAALAQSEASTLDRRNITFRD